MQNKIIIADLNLIWKCQVSKNRSSYITLVEQVLIMFSFQILSQEDRKVTAFIAKQL